MSGQVILYFEDQADALRFALAAGSVMAGEGSRVSDALVQETSRASRIRIDATRLLVYKAAWLMDTAGNKAARGEIAGIKIAAAATACQVVDWAIQAHGAGGLSDDFHLGHAYAQARAIRLADGPDEVHRNQIGRLELEKYA